MSPLASNFQWDAILPILIVVIWVVSRFFIKDEAEEGSESKERRQTYEEDPEEASRARNIQEEIRRRIQDRQEGGSGSGTGPHHHQQAPARKEPVQTRSFQQASPARQDVEHLSWDQQARNRSDDLKAKLAQQLERVRETSQRSQEITRKTAAAAAARAKKARPKREVSAAYTQHQRVDRGVALRSALKDDLSNPDGARKAFLFAEIVGSPVAIRKVHPVHLDDTW